MHKVSNILVTVPTELHHRELLESCAPDAKFTYCLAKNLEDKKVRCADVVEMTDEMIKQADVVLGVIGVDKLKIAENLKFLQLSMAGSDAYAAPGVMPKGALLANATGSYGLAISEYLMASLLAISKRLHQYRDRQPKGAWEIIGEVKPVYGSTVLVVGLGDIGGEFAKRAKAMGAYVIGVRRKGTNKPDYVDELYHNEDLDSLIPRADTIALCLPNTPATQNIMNRDRIYAMKQDAILLNIGRGNAVDGEALCDALDEGRLWGAGLDVTDPEPLPVGHRMWNTEKLLLTPHVSGFFTLPETHERIIRLMADNLTAFIEGKPLKNIVDPETGYRKL